MTSEGGLILASVAMTSEGNAVNDVSDKGLQHPSSEPNQENVSVVKSLWAVTSTPPIEMSEAPGNADQQPVATATPGHTSKPLNMTTTTSGVNRTEDKGHPERKRRPSNDSHDSSTKMSESAVDDNRDDDDDNDDDDDETKLSSPDIDPERLKAFNLFVRLFIDENLDRSVPISKQPKDKIQAILEACDRQFAEFHDRARKRIRTYLKSCRRLRRSKEGATIDQIRPTPPHLTSAIAESILAQACENESNNAKRMRMGLEPLPAVSAPGPTGSNLVSQKPPSPPSAGGIVGLPPQPPPPPHRAPFPFPKLERASPVVLPQGLPLAPPPPPTETEKLRGGIALAGAPHPNCYDAQSLCYPTSAGSTVPRSAYPTGYQRPAHYHHHHHHHQNTTTTTTPLTNNNNNSNNNNNNSQLQNGPTDLSLKSSNNSTSSSGKNQLNSSEMATIRQLIAGYRESAAFLFRSADELEQLLIHHK